MFSAHHLSPANLPSYVDELRRRRPPWVHGYPSLIAVVAAHLVATGTDLGYPVRWVTTGAENLLPQQRTVIEQAFGVTPRQHYGSTEAVAQLSECPLGRLHVDEDFAALECVADDAGRTRILGTNLSNPATPLIRYEVGDLVTLADTACSCGRPGRIVAALDGRQEDYVVTRSGARVAALNHVFKDLVRVREAQLVQDRAGHVTIRVVRGDGYSAADDDLLRREAAQRLGAEMEISIEHAEQLARTETGKLRLVVSRVGPAAG
jgi:phenylacetate-CoA ligase